MMEPFDTRTDDGSSGTHTGRPPGLRPQILAADEVTLEIDSPGSRPAPRICPWGDSTGTGMSAETVALLRTRLRAAALVLFIGSGAFLIWVFYAQATTQLSVHGHRQAVLNALHVAFVLVEGLCAALLWSRLCLAPWMLRLFETAIFGLPALYFVVMGEMRIRVCAQVNDHIGLIAAVSELATPWLCLIMVYGMFIPNNWRRAAMVVVPMALLPLAILQVARWSDPTVAATIPALSLSAVAIYLSTTALMAIYGTHTIHSLRREAYAARQLGQYKLRALLGVGGMGEVYLAEHQLLKRPCAIKLIRPGRAADPRALARFEREVRATAKLSHWNSVEIFDYGRADDGTFYYVMEYLPGLSIHDLVRRFGPLPPERTIHLLRQTCDALSEAHAAQLVHRDIKPGNLFAAQRGGVFDVAKLLDFGLVKDKDLTQHEDLELTTEGSVNGSPLYMAPEQARGLDPDARTDIYSLGAVAYFMLTGRPPFEGPKAVDVIIAHARDPVVPPSMVRPGIPTDLEQVVLRCLAKDPTRRYASAQDLKAALAACELADGWSEERARQWWAEIGQRDEAAVSV
ncbi:MAG: serine/threonine protein kinase [Pirellulales bacterium]|nr:serine/threonine protein kinase [Pirellulales bacterium]